MPARPTSEPALAGGEVLVGGVGYRNLRDLSFGPLAVERLAELEWPDGVLVEDLSYGPIGVLHRLDERPPRRIVLVAAARRGIAPPGTIRRTPWRGELPGEDEVQARVAEAVTGVISLENLLVVAERFGRLPADVVVLEVEAEDEGWGEGFTPAVEAALPCLVEAVRREVARPAGGDAE